MKIQYTATLFNKFKRPYYYSNSTEVCLNTDYSSYQTTNLNLFKQIIKDFLDVPETEMTLTEIKQQFADVEGKDLPEEDFVAIQEYYNGRLALYNYIMEFIELNITSDIINVKTQFHIPYKYNCFFAEDNKNEKQIESYIEVEIKSDTNKNKL